MQQTIRHRISPRNTPALLFHSHASAHNLGMPTIYAERLGALMKERGENPYSLEKLSKVPQPTIQRILKGTTKNPKADTLLALAVALRTDVSELTGSDPRPRRPDDPAQQVAPAGAAEPALTPRERAMLGFFRGLTDEQQEAALRELSETQQVNQAIVDHFLSRQKAS